MTTALRIFAINLPSEYIACGITIADIIATPIFAVWAIHRYHIRPRTLFVYLCLCVALTYIVQIILIIGSNIQSRHMRLFLAIANNIFYPTTLGYMLLQTKIMRLFLYDHLKKFVWRFQVMIIFLYATCTPPLWLYRIVFDDFGPPGSFWSVYSYFGLSYLLIVLLYDMAQSIYALYYLAQVVIQMYTKALPSTVLTETIKKGIYFNQIILSIFISATVLSDIVLIILIMIPLPENSTKDILSRVQTAYTQIAVGLGTLHAIRGTIVLERMRDFKNIAEAYKSLGMQKSVETSAKKFIADEITEVYQVARPTINYPSAHATMSDISVELDMDAQNK
ncbi:hypothetical protein QVD99_004677 [Batrachochytrium dendrobatidis]|nr:hypothetical protein O5D80_002913 [Batrachochytrium dendrobatidis]KAK5668900.1 hypothetical protein QVD99_004677 [Batrachochytrium dendrobatidis]